jgi:hypothetical protein
MKTLLKILLISGSLYACKNSAGDGAMDSKDSNNIAMPPDSVLRNRNGDGNGSSSNSEDPGDAERETTRQITLNRFHQNMRSICRGQ